MENNEQFELFELIMHLRCMRRLQKTEYEFVHRSPELVHQEIKVDASLEKIEKRIASVNHGINQVNRSD
ncbi:MULTISPECIES: hypothetical protein [unclassified Synechocystis]|uniref:hypothetical protein n=1 Tax=unclassified Synechocystis TaxID=2640012 RepID=UPI000404C15C|nr:MULTISPECIES: hypothetical protein [unclassified Synechocystis]AIE73854.1 hypothetical protein D082_13260 [Synechocystis sp. PCC 6714]MCT0252332.1 hypothetical protein [Synechocystis sp. CS-94]